MMNANGFMQMDIPVLRQTTCVRSMTLMFCVYISQHNFVVGTHVFAFHSTGMSVSAFADASFNMAARRLSSAVRTTRTQNGFVESFI